ncbi:hypothetical protein JCM8097_000993 [Rhodosporidiobolus ruineniae]
MSDLIQITTADGALLEASRANLVAHSRVLADLLELPVSADSGQEAVQFTLAESAADLSVLLAVISGEETRRKRALAELSQVGFEQLCRMADKYDVDSARMAVQIRWWNIMYEDENPLAAFSLACLLHDEDLISRTSPYAITQLMNSEPCGADSGQQDRLRRWHLSRKVRASDIANLAPLPEYGPDSYCTYTNDAHSYTLDPLSPCQPMGFFRAWHDGLRFALLDFKAEPEFASFVGEHARLHGLCEEHGGWLYGYAERLEEQFQGSAPGIE